MWCAFVFFVALGALYVWFAVTQPDHRAELRAYRLPWSEKSTLDVLRWQYVQDQLKGRTLAEIERSIEETELALRYPHNNIERDIQRENLTCLNTAYVMKLMQLTEAKFWALQKQ